MDRLTKYERVNSCETIQALVRCIKDFSENGVIKGRSKDFDSEKMALNALNYFKDETNTIPPNRINSRIWYSSTSNVFEIL